jgi:hypothetical protein
VTVSVERFASGQRDKCKGNVHGEEIIERRRRRESSRESKRLGQRRIRLKPVD